MLHLFSLFVNSVRFPMVRKLTIFSCFMAVAVVAIVVIVVIIVPYVPS